MPPGYISNEALALKSLLIPTQTGRVQLPVMGTINLSVLKQ